jgi:hypothetical protein
VFEGQITEAPTAIINQVATERKFSLILMIYKLVINFDSVLPVGEKRNLSIFDDIFILQTSCGKNISPIHEKHMIFCQV